LLERDRSSSSLLVCLLLPLTLAGAAPIAGAGCSAGLQPAGPPAGGGGAVAGGASGGAGNGGGDGTGGRMRAGLGGAGGGGIVTDAGNCGLEEFKPNPTNADILLVLDRSASMRDDPSGGSGTPSKWDIVVPTLNAVVAATDASILWGLKTFPEGTASSCSAGSVTSAIDAPVAARNGAAVTGTISATSPDGNGTPTGDAINAAVAYLKKLTDDNPKYILLATDGEPSCAAIPTSESTTSARPYAVQAVTTASKTDGVPTFVVGIATTKASDTMTLNQLADAGGEVPATASNPLAPHFFLASDGSSLSAALEQITGQVSLCLFKLGSPPPVPNDPMRLGVYLDGGATKIPYDGNMSNGWAYTDTSDSYVQVYGPWCDKIQAAGAGAVQIIFGCPDIIVP
jgi:hypothetical protein